MPSPLPALLLLLFNSNLRSNMNLFDGMQKAMFSTVTNTFGYDAAWLPSAGGSAKRARVLLKEPTKEHELAGMTYTPTTYVVEWWGEDWEGLKESIDYGNSEQVEVNGKTYDVRAVTLLYDGKNNRAVLELQ